MGLRFKLDGTVEASDATARQMHVFHAVRR